MEEEEKKRMNKNAGIYMFEGAPGLQTASTAVYAGKM